MTYEARRIDRGMWEVVRNDVRIAYFGSEMFKKHKDPELTASTSAYAFASRMNHKVVR